MKTFKLFDDNIAVKCKNPFTKTDGTVIYDSVEVAVRLPSYPDYKLPFEFESHDQYYVQDVKLRYLKNCLTSTERIESFPHDLQEVVRQIYAFVDVKVKKYTYTNPLLKSEFVRCAAREYFVLKQLEHRWLDNLLRIDSDYAKTKFTYNTFIGAHHRFIEKYGTLYVTYDKMYHCGFDERYLYNENGFDYFLRFLELLPGKYDRREQTFILKCFTDISSEADMAEPMCD